VLEHFVHGAAHRPSTGRARPACAGAARRSRGRWFRSRCSRCRPLRPTRRAPGRRKCRNRFPRGSRARQDEGMVERRRHCRFAPPREAAARARPRLRPGFSPGLPRAHGCFSWKTGRRRRCRRSTSSGPRRGRSGRGTAASC
jgi:hypothetical protein